ncbi:MAG: NAD(P)-dependent oxidoreductase [Pseudomonadota bacterium]
MTKQKIGFIGLGLMGAAMVKRLMALDYPMTVLANRSRTAVEAAVAAGAVEASSAKELAEASDIIMLCVDTSASVESRMLGEDGIIAGLSDGKTVIDFGTSLPQSTRDLGDAVAKTGATMLDAPLGRTPAHAVDGLLNIMCSGDKSAFDRINPVLDDLGENVFHLGALGSGHTVKLINNFFGMTVATAWSEAMGMAKAAGVDQKQLYEVVSAGPLHSGMMDFVSAYPLDGDPNKLEFAIKNARKDVGYYSRMADDLGAPSVISTGPKQALGIATSQGYGDKMVSEMVDFFTELYRSED